MSMRRLPKVTHGYHLIRKYGCYGCHEVNGFDGPNASRRAGPALGAELFRRGAAD